MATTTQIEAAATQMLKSLRRRGKRNHAVVSGDVDDVLLDGRFNLRIIARSMLEAAERADGQ